MNILLQDTGDGGELILDGGDIKEDKTFLTALYLSLFTGDCYYNVYEEHETSNEFEECLALPITVANLKKTERAAKDLTKWFVDEGVADSIEVKAKGNSQQKQDVSITITEPSGEVSTYGIIWDNERRILKKY